jgi:hypothetical protein
MNYTRNWSARLKAHFAATLPPFAQEILSSRSEFVKTIVCLNRIQKISS